MDGRCPLCLSLTATFCILVKRKKRKEIGAEVRSDQINEFKMSPAAEQGGLMAIIYL